MKSTLIILSDLWGFQNADWVKYYFEELDSRYQINLLDVRELGEIDPKLDSEESIHQEFIDKGIDKAVDKLLEGRFSNTTIIAFSIGGLIGWKAALQGLRLKKLISISSTRLRYEVQKPPIDLELFYGNDDPYKPEKEWFEKMKVNPHFLKGSHAIYKKQRYIKTFTGSI